VQGGLNVKWNRKMIKGQSSDLGSYWTFFVLTAFQTEDFFYFPGLDGLPLPPPPALDGKVLDSWETSNQTRLPDSRRPSEWATSMCDVVGPR